jgi:hypothetical protein
MGADNIKSRAGRAFPFENLILFSLALGPTLGGTLLRFVGFSLAPGAARGAYRTFGPASKARQATPAPG